MSWVKLANDGDVHKTYARAVDARLLPPRVGHNWNDQAFRACHDVPQQLEGEWRGTRAFVVAPDARKSDADASAQPFGRSAQQLLAALAASSRRTRGRHAGDGDGDARAMTLDDKVLRFYAFFRERVPEGGLYDFWYRYVVLLYYLVDDTVHIYEPHVPNSGLDGGVFLRRQRVTTDARQRERHPDEAHLTVDYFVVGESVRIHGIDFFVYDCDAATRALLTAVGARVADAVACPVNVGASARPQPPHAAAPPSSHRADGTDAVTSWCAQDSGKVLRFYAVLHERHSDVPFLSSHRTTAAAGRVCRGNRTDNNNNEKHEKDATDARHLELLVYAEDGSMAVVERPASSEERRGGGSSNGNLFLSRCWLPKSGSLAPLSELTFAHRVNGQRAPDMGGPDAYYAAADLDVGVTVNVLGRRVLLYDCDAFTRRFYADRYGVVLAPALDKWRSSNNSSSDAANNAVTQEQQQQRQQQQASSGGRNATTPTSRKPRDVLRFFLRLAQPRDAAERCRRFTLAYYTDTCECSVYESVVLPNSGYTPGCMVRRQQLHKPQPPVRFPCFAPPPATTTTTATSSSSSTTSTDYYYYTEDDLRVGKQVVVCGLCMTIANMDAHTAAYIAGDGAAATAASDEQVEHLLSELLEYLGSRYSTAVAAFLAFDHDRDGVIGVAEFAASLRRFQITDDAALARRLFARIASPSPPSLSAAAAAVAAATAERDTTAAMLTTNDLMTWMAGTTSSNSNSNTNVAATEDDAAAQTRALAARALRLRALTRLRERLEARCLTCTDMFRLASTMPRAYASNKSSSNSNSSGSEGVNSMHTLCNIRRDAVITPVQLRRCVCEVLGGAMPDDELRCVLAFFYPMLSPEEAVSRVCDADDVCSGGALMAAVDLPQFQRRFVEMCALAQLPGNNNNNSDSSGATRVVAVHD